MVQKILSEEYVKEIRMETLHLLFEKSKPVLLSTQEAPIIRYQKRIKARKIVYDGYVSLPSIYQEVFLDPLKNLLLTQDYTTILHAMDSGGGPWGDWLAAIEQRQKGYQREATRAFEECIADLYDGFLSMEERKGIKPPDHQTVSPLVEWGRSKWGPYTWPAPTGNKIGMKMSVVSMPPAYSKNIAFWSALGHEAGGHDILHADDGLLKEIGNKVEAEILKCQNDPEFKFKDQKAIVNGREKPLPICAAAYWKYTIDETASDVCGVLNLGPAAGIGLATLLIPLRARQNLKMRLSNSCPSSSFHPIDTLRILLAADVVRELPDLDVKIANAWADVLENIVKEYRENENELILYTETADNVHGDDKMPYEGMREIVKIVADTIAFTPFESLEGHQISEINTWTNEDEIITMKITDDLIAKKEPSIESESDDEEDIYAAHILAGAIIALAKSPDIDTTTQLATKALNKLHNNNPVWRGFPVRFRSDAHLHHMVPSYRKAIPENPLF
jgi:hypothetical protein